MKRAIVVLLVAIVCLYACSKNKSGNSASTTNLTITTILDSIYVAGAYHTGPQAGVGVAVNRLTPTLQFITDIRSNYNGVLQLNNLANGEHRFEAQYMLTDAAGNNWLYYAIDTTVMVNQGIQSLDLVLKCTNC